MSAIAYITDSKLLELHRLNSHQKMNFWRVSTNTNFSDFGIDDLVFFLSKDKQYMKNKEKAIVGFGRCKKINVNTVNYMWNKYGIYNGYNTLDEFKEAIIKVTKNKKLPKKISSFQLENVYFTRPIYLSECGLNISNNVESYIYIDDEISLKLLALAKQNTDIWTSDNLNKINDEEFISSLFIVHKKIKDIYISDALNKKAHKALKVLEGYNFITNSINEVYNLKNNNLNIVYYYDKKIDYRLLLGQKELYINLLKDYLDRYNVTFYYLDKDKNINNLDNLLNLCK